MFINITVGLNMSKRKCIGGLEKPLIMDILQMVESYQPNLAVFCETYIIDAKVYVVQECPNSTACEGQMCKGTMLDKFLSIPKEVSHAQTSVAVLMMMMMMMMMNVSYPVRVVQVADLYIHRKCS